MDTNLTLRYPFSAVVEEGAMKLIPLILVLAVFAAASPMTSPPAMAECPNGKCPPK